MAWLDDRIWAHPKYQRIDPLARWVAVSAIAYSSGFGLGGRLDKGQQKIIGSNARIRKQLVDVELWHDEGDSIVINDWDEHNSKRESKRLHEREQARERKRRERSRKNSAIPGQVTLDVTPHVTRDNNRDIGRDVPRAHARTPAPPMTGDRVTGEEEQQQEPRLESSSLHATREQDRQEGEPAAAEAWDQPPTDTDVETAIRSLEGHDPGSMQQILPLALALPAPLFQDALERTRARIANGNVGNHVGLLVTLLKAAGTEQRARTQAQHRAAAEAWTLTDQLDHDARSYARGKHPWPVVAEIFENRIRRDAADQDPSALLDHARAAYHDQLNPEPTLAGSTTTTPTTTITD